ncbi:hypothetical protein N665_0056s0035 [Sinapis alba]|nr:hypothetical protein N665_0056s0035 [Sinapis alba]
MDPRREDTTSITLPERMFAIGKEPIGVRILRALEKDETDLLCRSQFGRLIEIAEKPIFSGRFGRYLMSRQLRVRKKHEAWFLFAGKPVRFSLREFSLVTRLNCGQYPRVKYALLALLASEILPTTHTPCISHKHAEKIKNLDVFLAFPWGRLSFDLLMSSIKERNELVMVEAIPALTEAVHEGGSSDSEGDFAEDEDVGDELSQGKISISPGHERETDCVGKAAVLSIISVGNTDLSGENEFGWSDEEADLGVDNLLQKIEEGYLFSHSSFIGGASKSYTRKTTKHKTKPMMGDAVGVDYVATSVKARLAEDISRIESEVKNLAESFTNFQTLIVANIEELFKKFQGEIIKMINPLVVMPSHPFTELVVRSCVISSPPINTSTIVDAADIIENAMHFVDSAGIEISNVLPRALVGDYQCDKTFLSRAWEAYVIGSHTGDDIDYAAKFSKLIEMLDNPFSFNVNGVKVDSKDLYVLLDKSSQPLAKVVDVLTHQIRSVYNSHTNHLPPTLSTFLNTKFVPALSKNYTRFSKSVKKDSFKFPTTLCESLVAASSYTEASRFYFPFNFNKKHWVGVCIATTNWQLVVLDCNTGICTDALLSKEMHPASWETHWAKEMKTFSIERPLTVPQNHNQFESVITAVLLIHAHAFGGLDVCKCITTNVLEGHVQRAALKIVEENHAIILT